VNNYTVTYGVEPSGLWIDMNEFSNFVDGEKDPSIRCATPFENDTQRMLFDIDGFDLPFNPVGNFTLTNRTLSLDAYHYSKEDAKYLKDLKFLYEFDFHPLNGFLEASETFHALEAKQSSRVNFILTRSNFVGSG
jgi:alpha-glucosidase